MYCSGERIMISQFGLSTISAKFPGENDPIQSVLCEWKTARDPPHNIYANEGTSTYLRRALQMSVAHNARAISVIEVAYI